MQNKIKARLQPFQLEAVNKALQDLGVLGQTFSQVKQFGPPKDRPLFFRMKKQRNDTAPEMWIEMIVEQAMTEAVPKANEVLVAAKS